MVDIRPEFLEQAIQLTRNAEVLPGGVNELAVKLQHFTEKKKEIFRGCLPVFCHAWYLVYCISEDKEKGMLC